MIVLSQTDVRAHLTYARCIPLMRAAMGTLSRGETRQHLRSILDLEAGRAFGIMPGAMGENAVFGAKLISVFPQNFSKGLQSHQGLVILFDPESGAVAGLAHAGEITRIRTAAASAAATDALARADASRLAILGYGEQAHAHAAAISHVRALSDIRIWGRDIAKAEALARTLTEELSIPARAAASAAAACDGADIIATTSAAPDPIVFSADVADGAHVNAVGSSRAGPAEIGADLVARARFIADYRPGVLAQGAEFLRAKAEGVVEDAHVVGEIGEVFNGALVGRTSAGEVTLYKSLGHIVQDLAAGAALLEDARAQGFGQRVVQ